MVTDIQDLDFNLAYIYADYLQWTFEECVELIHGFIYPMERSGGTLHQVVLGAFAFQIMNYLNEHNKRVAYMLPFNVRFPEGSHDFDRINTIVQPDISVFLREDQLDEFGAMIPPTSWIIEIQSTSTSMTRKDAHLKFDLYHKAGVQGCWIVNPMLDTFQG